VVPVQDLVAGAIRSRSELQQSRIDMNNRDISIKTTKNSLLPQVDAFGTWTSRGVAGLGHVTPTPSNPTGIDSLGGLGGALPTAVFGRNPDYTLGFQVTVPLRNRSAQADLATSLLEKRQADLRMRQIENQVRVEVANAQIALVQNRVRIDAARKQRELAEKSLDAEQKKFQLGASTNYLVIQAQRDLTTALSAEVQALGLYMISKVEMDRTTGDTLLKNNISLEDAAQGQLKRPPTAVPVARQD
jgi:outer membrane protein TolC